MTDDWEEAAKSYRKEADSETADFSPWGGPAQTAMQVTPPQRQGLRKPQQRLAPPGTPRRRQQNVAIDQTLPPPGPLYDFATGKGGFIREGASQVGRGIQEMRQPGKAAKYTGASDIIKGVGSMAAPVAIGATAGGLAVAPLATLGATALGVGGAIAGAGTGREIARSVDASPEGEELASDIGSVAGGAVGGLAGGVLGYKGSQLDPARTLNRVFKPPGTDPQFPEITPEAISDVKRYGGKAPTTAFGMKDHLHVEHLRGPNGMAQNAVNELQGGMDTWVDQAMHMGMQIPGDPIADATAKAIPPLMWTRDPQGALNLINEANQQFRGKVFSPQEFRSWLKTENATLRAFYDRASAVQGAAERAGTPSGIEKAQADAMRETLYQHLDPQHNGAGPREIQRRTGQLIDLRDAADRRSNAVMAEKPLSSAEGVGRMAAAPLTPVRYALQSGDMYRAGAEMMHPFRGPSDSILTYLFRQSRPGADIPLPSKQPLAGLLPPGSIRMGPVPQQAYGTTPYPAPPPGFGSTSMRQLPASTAPYTSSPYMVPDIIGESSRGTGFRGVPQIEAPKPGELRTYIGPGRVSREPTLPLHDPAATSAQASEGVPGTTPGLAERSAMTTDVGAQPTTPLPRAKWGGQPGRLKAWGGTLREERPITNQVFPITGKSPRDMTDVEYAQYVRQLAGWE